MPIRCSRTRYTLTYLMLTLTHAGGCVHTDTAQRSWDVFADGKSTDRKVSVGQTRQDARTAIGDLLDERSKYLWVIRDQFRLVTPGLYPYFDSRSVYVYFIDDRVAAVVIRGEYNVYP